MMKSTFRMTCLSLGICLLTLTNSAVFSGHHHSGNFAYFKNIPIVTMEGMIETEKENAFAVVSIYTDRIMLDGRGRATSRSLPFSGHP